MIEPGESKFDLGLGDPKMEHRDITSAIPVEVGPPGYTAYPGIASRRILWT